MMQFVSSPWHDHFDALIRQAHSTLLISSPYIGRGPCSRVLQIKADAEETQELYVLVLTDLSPNTLLSGATDVSAICDMQDRFPKMEVRFLPSVHAKIYVADDTLAVVTSANMTEGGLSRNFEYGLRVDETKFVRRIKRDLMHYAALGTTINQGKLKFLSQISSELNGIRARAEKSIKSRLQSEFKQRLGSFENEIIRARAAGRAPTAIFADAIVYLLAHRAMPTEEIHRMVQKIHPDLCDDSVDRVIDGRHFGKKWKHSVRTAQQHLKTAGRIELRKGVWYLSRLQPHPAQSSS